MKKILFGTLLCLSFWACKKEEAPASPAAPSQTKSCTATVNGTAFSANSYSSITTTVPHYNISCSNQSSGNPTIQLNGLFQTGIHPVGIYPNYFSGTYRINNVNYTAVSGNFNISKNDTLSGHVVSHFTATFNFNTDTIAGVSYQITNGAIDYFN